MMATRFRGRGYFYKKSNVYIDTCIDTFERARQTHARILYPCMHFQCVMCVRCLYAGGGFGGSWKRRYFVLEQSTLRYFSNPGSDQRGVINLAEGRGVRQRDQCKVDWPYEAKKHLCFGIATESRTYYLYATDMQSIQ